MPKKIFVTMFLCMIFWLPAIPVTWGGQVVTPETRDWARDAVSMEKSMQAVTTGHTLAVLYFHNRSGDVNLDPLQKGLSVMLMTDLAKIETIQLVERVKLQALAEEIGLGRSGIVAPETAPRVGRLLGARYLIGGAFFKEALEKLRLRSDLINVPEEKIFDQHQVLDTLDRLFDLEKEMLFKIIGALKIEIPPARKKLLMEPMSTSYPALVYFFRGIDKSDQGDYAAAAMFYKKALAEDPKLHPADVNMKELNQLGLWQPVKRTAGLLKSLQSRTSLTDRLTAEYPTARLNSPQKVLSAQIEGYIDTPGEDFTSYPGEQLFYTEAPPYYYEGSDYWYVPVTADYVVRRLGPYGTPVTYYGISSGVNQGEYLGGSYEW